MVSWAVSESIWIAAIVASTAVMTKVIAVAPELMRIKRKSEIAPHNQAAHAAASTRRRTEQDVADAALARRWRRARWLLGTFVLLHLAFAGIGIWMLLRSRSIEDFLL